MIRKLMAAVALTAALLMTGCASVPMASKDADAKAKQFAPSQGVASLYVYRNEFVGAAIKMNVLVDGTSLGDTVANSYIFKTLPAGSHTIVSKAENDSSLTLEMVAGQTYFVWQEVKMGVLYARSKLHLVDEATGEAGVKDCALVKGDGSADETLAAAPAPASSPVPVPPAPPAAAPAPDPVTSTTSATTAGPAPQTVASADPAPPPAPVAPVPAQDAATIALAQTAASQVGCGTVQPNGGSTFIAPCDGYSVLIDCYDGQCRPMHTVNVKKED
jgi:hypothetical protein